MTPGTRIGPYEIVSALGAGGMGEVYRARDSKLKREVAIKVLPADVANDRDPSTSSGSPRASSRGERLARFQREAEVLASLNHPHIAHVYGIEDNALVMELVEGDDLSQRIARGPIPIDEALPIAKQIAEALEAAHDAGIIHRDLKPANVKVRPDGTVKVLDFGLAKAMEPGAGSREPGTDLANSPTITTPAMTMRGVILGTAAYMSPEQAKGKAVDKRADIWAFGCVLYEMLTGARAFTGDNVSEILAEVLKTNVDLTVLPADTPANVRAVIERCLQREPKQRLRDIGEARIALASPGVVAPVAMPPTRGLSYSAAAIIALACTGVAAGVMWFAARPAETPPRPLIRAMWPIPAMGSLRMGVQRHTLTLSANGRTLAVISNGIHVRATDALMWTAVPNTVDATAVFASPDGEWLGYSNRSGLWKVRLSGGAPIQVMGLTDSATFGVFGAAWGDDGRIYYIDRTGLYSRPDGGGEPQTILEGTDFDSVHALPGGVGLLYGRGRLPASSVVLHLFDGSAPVTLAEGSAAKFVAPDLLVFVRRGTLMGARIDLAARRLLGEPTALVEEIAATSAGTPQYDVSRDGILIHMPVTLQSEANAAGRSLLTLRDSKGSLSGLSPQARRHSDPRLSPDAKRLALHVVDDDDDIWIYEIERGTMTRFTFEAGEDETPAWSPDGRWLAFAGLVRGGGTERAVFRRRADGSGTEEVLWSSTNHSHVTDWSPDGRSILVEVVDPRRRSDIVVVDVAARTMTPLIATQFNEAGARVSPDGKWLAYQSHESGRPEVYLQSFPGLGNKVQVSTDGGEQPVWSRDGRTLFFRTETDFRSARIDTKAGAIHVSAPVALFLDTFMRPQVVNHTTYEVFGDGRLLLFQPPNEIDESEGAVIGLFNWLDDVRRKVQ